MDWLSLILNGYSLYIVGGIGYSIFQGINFDLAKLKSISLFGVYKLLFLGSFHIYFLTIVLVVITLLVYNPIYIPFIALLTWLMFISAVVSVPVSFLLMQINFRWPVELIKQLVTWYT